MNDEILGQINESLPNELDDFVIESPAGLDYGIFQSTKLYRELEYGEQMVIFADPADSKDYCAAVALSKKHYDCPLVFNDIMPSAQFGYELYNIGKYIFNRTGLWPRLAVERNTGQATIHVLTTLNYPDLFRMVDFTSNVNKGGQIGWLTTGYISGGELIGTRRKMLDDLALAIRQEIITIYDEAQIRQLMAFMIVKGRAQAKANKHDDLCFVKGTLILTDKGQVPIEQIKVGDKVLTREGYKPIVKTMNRYKGVITNIGLTGTPNHPVFTTKGIKDLQKIQANDIIYIWNQKTLSIEEATVNILNEKLLSTKETSIIDTQSQKIDNTESILWDILNGERLRFIFIGKFGWTILERFLKGILFIIKIIILSIIRFPILHFFPEANMPNITWVPPNGKEYRVSVVKNKLKGWLGNLESGKQITPNLLVKLIRKVVVSRWQKYMPWGYIFTLRRKKRVYNLQVADTPEYFANNILVHNCMATAGAWQIHLATPVMDLEEYDEEEIASQREKWRFK